MAQKWRRQVLGKDGVGENSEESDWKLNTVEDFSVAFIEQSRI
jgi:hypothetical protein